LRVIFLYQELSSGLSVLAENRIRLRYSGFILFLSRLVSVGTGLLFTLMVTRRISLEDYGIYGNLGDVLSYFMILSSIVPFWVTRFVARGQIGSFKTGFTINILIGLSSTAIYLVSTPSILYALQISLKYMPIYSISALLIIENYILSIFEAAIYPRRPEKLGFGLLAFEASKVLLGFILIIRCEMGLMGGLISIIAASFIQILFYLKDLLHEFHEKIVWDYAKEWFKASILNIYGIIGGRLLMLANLLLFIYGGELSRAYFGASSTIASIVTFSSSLAFALYSKLLSNAELRDVMLSIKMVLMFAIPMSLGAIILSESLLYLLNPSYSAASLILMVLSLNALFSSIASIFESIISGTERFDVEAKLSFRRVLKSRLLSLLTLRYIQALIVVLPIYLILPSLSHDALLSTLYFVLIGAVSDTALTLAKYFMAKRCINFNMPWASIGKNLCASLAMAAVLLVFQAPPRLLVTLTRVLIGALTYFSVLSIIDREVRETIKSAEKEIMKMLKIEGRHLRRYESKR